MPAILEIYASSNYRSLKFLCAARQKERNKQKSLAQIERMRLKLQSLKHYFQGSFLLFEKQK